MAYASSRVHVSRVRISSKCWCATIRWRPARRARDRISSGRCRIFRHRFSDGTRKANLDAGRRHNRKEQIDKAVADREMIEHRRR